MTRRTRHGTLRLMTTLYWTRTKLTWLKSLCHLMRFVRNLWRRLKPEGQKCLRKIGLQFGEEPEIGDYYIAVDLAGFEEVNKKRTKNTKLDETAIAVVKVSADGWYVDNIIYGRWSLDETATKIFQAVRDYRPISRWY